MGTDRKLKSIYLCATALSTMFGSPASATTFPTGFYLAIDPYTKDLSFLESAANKDAPGYNSLFGTFSAGCPGASCTGGIIGIYLKVNWVDYQTQQYIDSTLKVVTDNTSGAGNYTSNVEMALYYIEKLEAAIGGPPLKLTIGLEAGYNASFQALDVYQISNGNSFTPGAAETSDINCGFQLSGTTIVGDGGSSSVGTGLFPEQCTLKGATPDQCNPQVSIWASDASSQASNSYYISAYTAAVTDLAHQITSGGTATGGLVVSGHNIDILKFAGVADHDVEVGIDGNPGLLMPSSNGTTYSCGFTSTGGYAATDAEAIWTDQSSTGTNYYDTGIMESTFGSIVTNLSMLVASTTGATISNFAIDVYGDNDFPPVGPRHCHYPTACTYTAAGSSSIVTLTTGEEEYLIEGIISNGGRAGSVNPANIGIQTQGLQAGMPSDGESNYYTNEIPCAMQSHYHTAIGYQSLAQYTFTASSDNTIYLQSLSNGGTYGAEYEELIANEISSFVSNTSAGITEMDLMADLSSTMYTVSQQMQENRTGNATSTLCPGGGGFTTY